MLIVNLFHDDAKLDADYTMHKLCAELNLRKLGVARGISYDEVNDGGATLGFIGTFERKIDQADMDGYDVVVLAYPAPQILLDNPYQETRLIFRDCIQTIYDNYDCLNYYVADSSLNNSISEKMKKIFNDIQTSPSRDIFPIGKVVNDIFDYLNGERASITTLANFHEKYDLRNNRKREKGAEPNLPTGAYGSRENEKKHENHWVQNFLSGGESVKGKPIDERFDPPAPSTPPKVPVIVLFGKSGVGKDTLLKEILKVYPQLNPIVSHTTRPQRDYEVDGVDYHFVTDKEFARKVLNGDMMEAVEFNGWHYGAAFSSLAKDKVNIGIFNLDGIEAIKQDPRLECYYFAIESTEKNRMLRALERESDPDVKEIVRRFKADEEQFEDVDEVVPGYVTIDNDGKLSSVVSIFTVAIAQTVGNRLSLR